MSLVVHFCFRGLFIHRPWSAVGLIFAVLYGARNFRVNIDGIEQLHNLSRVSCDVGVGRSVRLAIFVFPSISLVVEWRTTYHVVAHSVFHLQRANLGAGTHHDNTNSGKHYGILIFRAFLHLHRHGFATAGCRHIGGEVTGSRNHLSLFHALLNGIGGYLQWLFAHGKFQVWHVERERKHTGRKGE